MLDLSEIRAVTEKTTPGEWKVVEHGNTVPSLAVVNEVYWENPKQVNVCSSISPNREADADFIASARQWVPALCDEVEADREKIKAMESDEINSEMNLESLTAEVEGLNAEVAVLHRALHLMACDICDNIHRLQDEGIIKITRDSTAGQECAVYIQRAREEMEK